jgi:hypothetical protein
MHARVIGFEPSSVPTLTKYLCTNSGLNLKSMGLRICLYIIRLYYNMIEKVRYATLPCCHPCEGGDPGAIDFK